MELDQTIVEITMEARNNLKLLINRAKVDTNEISTTTPKRHLLTTKNC